MEHMGVTSLVLHLVGCEEGLCALPLWVLTAYQIKEVELVKKDAVIGICEIAFGIICFIVSGYFFKSAVKDAKTAISLLR